MKIKLFLQDGQSGRVDTLSREPELGAQSCRVQQLSVEKPAVCPEVGGSRLGGERVAPNPRHLQPTWDKGKFFCRGMKSV